MANCPHCSPAQAPGSGSSPVVRNLAVASAVLFVFVLLMGAVAYRTFVRAREHAVQACCESYVKQVGLYLNMYCQDYDGCFPPAPARRAERRPPGSLASISLVTDALATLSPDDWRRLILPYSMPGALICPSTMSIDSYQFNDNFYGVSQAQVRDRSETVCVYDTGFLDGSWPPPHSGGYVVAYADAHAKWLGSKAGVEVKP